MKGFWAVSEKPSIKLKAKSLDLTSAGPSHISNMHLPMWALRQAKYASLGKLYIMECKCPGRRSVLKSRTEAASVADAKVCSTFRMHFGHHTSANPQGDAVFGRASKSAQILFSPSSCSMDA